MPNKHPIKLQQSGNQPRLPLRRSDQDHPGHTLSGRDQANTLAHEFTAVHGDAADVRQPALKRPKAYQA